MSFYEDPLRPFEMPEDMPQSSEELKQSFEYLIHNAPDWDPETFALELATLVRNHVALRSLFKFALVQSGMYETELRGLDSKREIHRTQGKITGLLTFVNTIMTHLEEAENPKEPVQ